MKSKKYILKPSTEVTSVITQKIEGYLEVIRISFGHEQETKFAQIQIVLEDMPNIVLFKKWVKDDEYFLLRVPVFNAIGEIFNYNCDKFPLNDKLKL